MATDDFEVKKDPDSAAEPRDAISQNESSDYVVGYARPPSRTRFQKGQSGNPKGRPKGSKNHSTILNEELEQRVVIRENGKQKTITKRRAAMKQLTNKAAAGDQRAIQTLLYWLDDREKSAGVVSETPRLDEDDQAVLVSILNRIKAGANDKRGNNGNTGSEPE